MHQATLDQTISGWMLIRWMLQASSLDARKHPDFRKIRIQTGDKHPKGNLGILHSGHYKCNFELHTRFLLHKQQFLVFCFTFLPKILARFFVWMLICILDPYLHLDACQASWMLDKHPRFLDACGCLKHPTRNGLSGSPCQ